MNRRTWYSVKYLSKFGTSRGIKQNSLKDNQPMEMDKNMGSFWSDKTCLGLNF